MVLLALCAVKPKTSVYTFASLEQKKALEKFFRNILFFERGIYTLLGSKPITTFDLLEFEKTFKNHFPDTSQYPEHRIYLNKNNRDDLQLYTSLKHKKNTVLVSNQDYIFDNRALWQEWEHFRQTINISKKYLIIKREFSPEEKRDLDPSCKNGYHIVLVNTLETAYLLKTHYEFFKKLLGEEFNPLEEVLNIENADSALWKCLFDANPADAHQAKGLLLGCDYKDVQFFSWKYDRSLKRFASKNLIAFLDQLEGYPTETLDTVLHKSHPFSAKNFPLPAFVTFSPLPVTRIRYEKEREEIMKFYKGKDFVESTLDILTNKI